MIHQDNTDEGMRGSTSTAADGVGSDDGGEWSPLVPLLTPLQIQDQDDDTTSSSQRHSQKSRTVSRNFFGACSSAILELVVASKRAPKLIVFLFCMVVISTLLSTIWSRKDSRCLFVRCSLQQAKKFVL